MPKLEKSNNYVGSTSEHLYSKKKSYFECTNIIFATCMYYWGEIMSCEHSTNSILLTTLSSALFLISNPFIYNKCRLMKSIWFQFSRFFIFNDFFFRILWKIFLLNSSFKGEINFLYHFIYSATREKQKLIQRKEKTLFISLVEH